MKAIDANEYRNLSVQEKLERLSQYYNREPQELSHDFEIEKEIKVKSIASKKQDSYTLPKSSDKKNLDLDWDKIKQIPIISILADRGILPVQKTGNTALYNSPFREDKHPSFSVKWNRWTDFATSEKGTVIDLIMKLDNLNSYEAAKYLMNSNFSSEVNISQSMPVTEYLNRESSIIIDAITDIKDFRLIDYLKRRKIDIGIARKFCKELHYHTPNTKKNKYFGVGFMNNNGGFEIRNPYFKGSSSKDITYIPNVNGGDNIAVFEGFFDMLSYATINRFFPENILVLNSVVNIDKATEHLDKAKEIHCFFDRDTAGIQAFGKIKNTFSDKGKIINDRSHIYAGFKDFNEYLQQGKDRKQQLQKI